MENGWEHRIGLLYRFMPYGLLAAGLGIAALSVSQGYHGWDRFGAAAAVSAATMAWIAVFTSRANWMQRRDLMTLYLAVRLILTAVLVALNPWFAIFCWAGYVDSLRLPLYGGRISAALGVLATATVMAASEVGGLDVFSSAAVIPIYLGVFALNVVLAGTMGGVAVYVAARNEQRRVALDELAEAHRKLSETLRENAGLHAQLLSQAREAGVLDERARLAREIHDTIAQGLAGIITQLQVVQRTREVDRHVDTALELARQSLGEARRSVQALRPAPLDDAQLPDALAQVVADWSRVHAVPAEAVVTGTARPLHPEIEVTLLRATQESLANVARHARAGRVGVTLSYMEDVITLDVRDDGIGFDPAQVDRPSERGGFGLLGMEQRVARLGGSLAVESEPGAGTAVSATVPAVPAVVPA